MSTSADSKRDDKEMGDNMEPGQDFSGNARNYIIGCPGNIKNWCTTACAGWRKNPNYPYFVKGDFDAFCGLFFDCMATTLVLVNALFFFPSEMIYGRILPGVGVSLLFGNLWYGWMARRLALTTGRSNVTAQPYGINTPGALAKVFLIIYPVWFLTGDAEYTYQVALGANFIIGMIEMSGCLVGGMVRKYIPPTALLTCLAGIGLAWLAINQVTALFAHPIVSWFPLMFVLMGYFAGVRIPMVPPTIIALLTGTILAWATGLKTVEEVDASSHHIKFYAPQLAIASIAKGLSVAYKYIDIIIPVAMTNFVGTLECTESAELAGDSYSTTESMIVDGIGTVLGACFGSIFGTTVYIGHPAYKKMGAKAGYSILNGVLLFILCFTGLLAPLFSLVAKESVEPIIVFVGLMICVQTFEHAKSKHWPAIMIGILPGLADWVVVKINDVSREVNGRPFTIAGNNVNLIDFNITQVPVTDEYLTSRNIEIHGIKSMAQGSLLVSLLLTTIFIHLIDRSFLKAAATSLLAALFSLLGAIHASSMFELPGAWRFAVAYSMTAVLYVVFWFLNKKGWLQIQSHAPDRQDSVSVKQGARLSVSANLDTLLHKEDNSAVSMDENISQVEAEPQIEAEKSNV